MANTDVHALQHSDLNGFLFADVGVEASGMTLSVLSTLARIGVDPWQEAGRLAKLPRAAAIDGLARIIAAMPASRWSLPDATAIAARLVALLPSGGAAAPVAGPGRSAPRLTARPTLRPNRQWVIILVVVASVFAALAFNLTGGLGGAPGGAPEGVSGGDAARHAPATSTQPPLDRAPVGG